MQLTESTATGEAHHSRETRELVIVCAGVSTGSPSSSRLLADRLADRTVAHLEASGVQTTVTVVEVRDHAMDIGRAFLQGFASPALEEALESVTAASGAIFVTPVFAASYSGLFKSFIDLLESGSIEGLPVLIGAAGGTERHSLVIDYTMRPLFSFLRAVITPTGVYAATSDWGNAATSPSASLPARIDRASEELAQLMFERETARERGMGERHYSYAQGRVR